MSSKQTTSISNFRAGPLLHNSSAFLGVLAAVVAIFFTAHSFWTNGYVTQRPVKIDLRGPVLTITGFEYYFHVEVDGTDGIPEWKMTPEKSGALTVSEDGRKARFQCAEDGTFTIIVSVAGSRHQVASDVETFENMTATEQVEDDSPPPSDDMTPPPPPTDTGPPIPNVQVTTVTELALQAYNDVDEAERASTGKTVAGSFKSVINRISAGQVASNEDPFLLVQEQVELTLGEHANAWAVFMLEVQAIIGQLRDQGSVNTAASYVGPLSEIANVLSAGR